MDFTTFEIILALIIVTLGALIQGSIGFGLGPFAVPLLLLIDSIFVPGPILLIALILTILMYVREKHVVKTSDIKWAVIGRFFGTVMAAFVLTIVLKSHLSLLFALIILLSLVISISGIKLRITIINLILVGIISGFMGTTAAIGGPPMGLLYQNEIGSRIRGTLSGIFMIGTILALISLMIIKKLSSTEFIIAVILLPGIFVGYYFSKYTVRILDKGYIRPAILSISGITSIFIIFRYFMSSLSLFD